MVDAERTSLYVLLFQILRGLLHHQMLEGGMTAEIFQQFVGNVSSLSADDAAFIFDNTSAHRRANHNAQEILIGAQIIRMLPPYSPMLNIVENAISYYKASLKRSLEEVRDNLLASNHDERMVTLAGLAETHLDAIRPEMAPAWFRKMQTYISACLHMEEILM